MTSKRENPLLKNKLLMAGKKRNELDDFLEEDDKEIVAEKEVEKIVPEKIEIKQDDKIEEIDQEKESNKSELENIVKTENKIDEDIPVKQNDVSDMSNIFNIPSVPEIKEKEQEPISEQVEVIKIPEVNIPEIKQPKDKEENHKEDKEEEKISSGFIVIKQKEASIEKKNVTYRLKQENIDRVEKYAGKGKGKSGYNKSELVDILLEKAFEMMKIK